MMITQFVNLGMVLLLSYLTAGLLSLRLEPEAGASLFDRNRQLELKNATAHWHKRREAALANIISLRMTAVMLIGILAAILTAYSFKAPVALLIMALFTVLSVLMARIGFVRRLAAAMYERKERQLVKFLAHRRLASRLTRAITFTTLTPLHNVRVHTRAELLSFLKNTAVLSATERKRLRAVMGSESTKVELIMTPREVLAGLEANDLLGPLRLSELHDTGQDFFPVEDRQTLVGVIDAQSIFEIDSRSSAQVRSKSAGASMTAINDFPSVYSNDSPYDALAVLEGSSHTVAAVYRSSNSKQCVGFVTIGVVLDAILGKTGMN